MQEEEKRPVKGLIDIAKQSRFICDQDVFWLHEVQMPLVRDKTLKYIFLGCALVTSTLTAYLTWYATLVHQGKGPSTQDKQHISWAALQSYAAITIAL